MNNPIYRAVAGMAFTGANKTAEHNIYRVTRRQARLVRLLDDGWVFELSKPAPRKSKRTGKPLHQRAPRLYLMRAPAAHETDGPVVTASTVDRLIELGFAIKVTHAWAGKTWIYSRSLYEKSPMGQAPSASASCQTGTTSPPSSSTQTSSTPQHRTTT